MPLPVDEPRISLIEARKKYPGHRGADRIHPATLTRWILRGAKVNGQRIRLEAERIGSRWLTSEAALARFAEALTAAASPDLTSDPPAIRTPTQRRKDAERAEAELIRRGA